MENKINRIGAVKKVQQKIIVEFNFELSYYFFKNLLKM